MNLILRAADGDRQPVSEATFAAAMNAVGALLFRGAARVEGCYMLDGDAADVDRLLADGAMEHVAERKYGGRARPECLELLGIRISGKLCAKLGFAYSRNNPLEIEEFGMPGSSVTETKLTSGGRRTRALGWRWSAGLNSASGGTRRPWRPARPRMWFSRAEVVSA